MQIVIDGRTYTTSVESLYDACVGASVAGQTLADGLATTYGMAGNDSTSTAFAASYTSAAREVAGAITELPRVLTSLGRALAASRANHLTAEDTNRAGLSGSGVQGGGIGADHHATWPTPMICGPPPQAAGSGLPDLPGWAAKVLSHVQGFVWPDADVDRLHAAAGIWRTAQSQVWAVMPPIGAACEALDGLRSPEIPIARGYLERVLGQVHGLSEACRRLAEACDSYADQVITQRGAILDIVVGLLRDTAILEAVGGVADFVIGPEATGGATAAALARIAAESPAILRCLEVLRTFGEAVARSLRGVVDFVDEQRLRHLESLRIYGAERGSFALVPDGEKGARDWLSFEEGGVGHVLDRHVGMTDAELMERFRRDDRLRLSSTFNDAQTARREILKVLRSHKQEIEDWLKTDSPKAKEEFVSPARPGIGRCLTRDGKEHVPTHVKVVLYPNSSAPRGFSIITSHPALRG